MEPLATLELDAQYRVLRESAGVLVDPERRILLATGPDAAEYLHGQLTQEIEGLEPGHSAYAALLDRKGHLQSDLRVSRTGAEEILLDLDPPGAERVLRHLAMYKIGREVELADVSAERALVRVIGPATSRLLGDLPTAQEGTVHPTVSIYGVGAVAIVTDVGADLICAREDAERLAAAIAGHGAEAIESAAAELIRIESGRPRFGLEMSERTMPAEAGIVERSVSFTKGCYIGQETVARLHYRGRPNRNLRGLRLRRPADPGAPIEREGKALGEIGSSAIHPTLGPIALAVLRREAEPGLTVEVDGEPADVVDLPFD